MTIAHAEKLKPITDVQSINILDKNPPICINNESQETTFDQAANIETIYNSIRINKDNVVINIAMYLMNDGSYGDLFNSLSTYKIIDKTTDLDGKTNIFLEFGGGVNLWVGQVIGYDQPSGNGMKIVLVLDIKNNRFSIIYPYEGAICKEIIYQGELTYIQNLPSGDPT